MNENEVSENNSNVSNKKISKGAIVGFLILLVFVILIFKGIADVFNISQEEHIIPDLGLDGDYAEHYALQYLGQSCRENELEVKAIEERDGIYIVKCTTTNNSLKTLYGETFYYGYMPNASGTTYKHYVDKSIDKVYEVLNEN